jgi:hypothetical protein
MQPTMPSDAPVLQSAPTDAIGAEAAIWRIQSGLRYFFEPDELARLVGRQTDSLAFKKSLYRLVRHGRVVLATKRPAGWLIVPPEQAHYGAPPVTWWLDDCLKRIEPNYYVALLSAARHWGSAHYALQDTQVMVSKPRPALTPGRLKVVFFSKREIANTPTVVVTSGVAPWRVSTPEATLLDLIRHQSKVGGLENVVRITKDVSRSLKLEDLAKALNAMDQAPVAQRLGLVLDHLGLERLAAHVAHWLARRRTTVQPLELQASTDKDAQVVDPRWEVQYDLHRINLFKELA